MELVWHNCKTHPPKETENDCLIATNGVRIYEAAWYAPDGFMIYQKQDDWWHSLYEDLNEWYWADIKQTVQGELRFKGLIVDDLVEDYKNYINDALNIDERINGFNLV